MWTLFNPTSLNIELVVGEGVNGTNGKLYHLDAGETLKFPDFVGEVIYNHYPFLQVLKKDTEQPKEKPVYVPPKNLDEVPEADFEAANIPRFIKHPSSSPEIVESGGFGPGDTEIEQANKIGGIKTRDALKDGKMVKIDGDKVEWYGGGVEVDKLKRR